MTKLPATPGALESSPDWTEMMGETQGSRKTLIDVLRRRRAWILVTVIACVGISGVITLLKSPTYEASALLVVDQRATSPSADLNATISTGQLLAAHYIKMVTTKTVLDPVCADVAGSCTYDSLKDHVTTDTVKGTDLLAVSVTDRSSSRAALLANLVAAKLMAEERAEAANALKPAKAYLDGELARLTSEIAKNADPQLVSVLETQYTTVYTRREAIAEQESLLNGGLSTVEGARVPARPVDPDPMRYLLAGLAVGLVVAVITALVVERVDDRIFGTESLSDATAASLVVTC
jgi:capsular polysaccharide biosynthesis protein